MNWLKQNWKKIGLVIVVLGVLVFSRGFDDSSTETALIDDTIPTSTLSLNETEEGVNTTSIVKENPTFNEVVQARCDYNSNIYSGKEVKWNAVVSPNAHTGG